MKNIFDGLYMLLQGFLVVISLMAGGVILVLAGLYEKIQGLPR
jgi:hypothetical protein